MRGRTFVQDARGGDRYLRVTWHDEAGQFNVSTWHGDVCSGAVRVRAEDAPALIALLSAGMGDALAAAHSSPPPPTTPRWRAWLDRHLHLRRAG